LKANRSNQEVFPTELDALSFMALMVERRAGEYPFPQCDISAYRNEQVPVGLQVLMKNSHYVLDGQTA
jgi:hypothetical protein